MGSPQTVVPWAKSTYSAPVYGQIRHDFRSLAGHDEDLKKYKPPDWEQVRRMLAASREKLRLDQQYPMAGPAYNVDYAGDLRRKYRNSGSSGKEDSFASSTGWDRSDNW